MLCLCEVGPTKTADLCVLQGEFCSSCTCETADRHAVCHDPWPPCRAMQVQKAASQQYLKALTIVICSYHSPKLATDQSQPECEGKRSGCGSGSLFGEFGLEGWAGIPVCDIHPGSPTT